METVRAATFNLWHGGEAGGQALERSAAVIRALGADCVGLQETRGFSGGDAAAALAETLGWSVFEQGGGCAILSRFPIVAQTDGRRAACIETPSGARLWLANVHLNHWPYQPYQLAGIPYGDAPFLTTPDEAIAAAEAARGSEIAAALAEVAGLDPIVLTGDFNEPSHRDWPEVAWPTTRAVEAAGFVDAYRAVRSDPGHTWTPTTAPDDPADRHDRIDFVFVRGRTVKSASLVGEGDIAPYPSDHRAVVATLRL